MGGGGRKRLIIFHSIQHPSLFVFIHTVTVWCPSILLIWPCCTFTRCRMVVVFGYIIFTLVVPIFLFHLFWGALLIWIIVGQGPIALAVSVGGGCLDIFSRDYLFSLLSPSMGDGPI